MFTLETEQNIFINFLDITIENCVNNSGHQLNFSVHRKPSTTEWIVPYSSCHLEVQKMAAIRYFNNRIDVYDLHPRKKIGKHK
jgi:hypothetical protein